MEAIGLGILIGIGLAVFGRKAARPMLKGTIKAGLVASEAAMEALQEGKEVLSDVVAEARHETVIAKDASAPPDAAREPEEPKGRASN
jgi:hypothetical protein